ncbi:MAG: extracellular solute-binding protein, partial [Clostridiales bacterium]|nr:extracellular solute-binding protein [Clostridiales bacterium]
MKKTRIKFVAFILSALCVAATVSGCAVDPSTLTLTYNFEETDQVVEYTFYSLNWESFERQSHDRVMKHIEDKFKVKINITGASSSIWKDRLATEIADGKTPDVFFTLPDESTFTDYIKKQVVTDINPYLERAAQTENGALNGVGKATALQKILNSEDYKKTTTVNGKNYFVPQSVGYTTRVMLARKDWVAKWNQGRGHTEDIYEQPRTLSEFTDMLKFFREGDPDGNGKQDTYGLQLSNNFDFVQDMFATFGIQPGYTVDANGDFQISAMQDNYNNMLEWFKDCCNKNYIYPEFATKTEAEALQLFYQNGCGVVLSVAAVSYRHL